MWQVERQAVELSSSMVFHIEYGMSLTKTAMDSIWKRNATQRSFKGQYLWLTVEMKGPCYSLSFVAVMVGFLFYKKEGHQTRSQVKVYKDLICRPVWEAKQVLVRVVGVISSVRQRDPYRKASEIRKSIVRGDGMWRSSVDGRRKSLSCSFLY